MAAKSKARTKAQTQSEATASPHLAYHAAERLPVRRLPFVGCVDGKGISFWNVPRIGGYGGGTETGAAMATAFLRHLKANPEFQEGVLQHIVLDMCAAYKDGLSAAEEASLRGQIVGFFSAICATLQSTAPLFGYELSATEETQVLKRANDGLVGDTMSAIRLLDMIIEAHHG